ncbi:MAG TPA: G/U mismatch-specific DNA glycosylase [Streptosporangiaceae bacterium]|nr:G/U mismatch-specific DNA glycosylase [Streptosporangiaceae bacterium]
MTSVAYRPSPADLAAARTRTIPDLVAPALRVLFAGINPGLYSAATGYHFARPGNRFWPALHQSGFTERQLAPAEQYLLPADGLGITNVVARATARADELTAAELEAGGAALAALAGELGVRWLAVLGVTAYRTAFSRPRAAVGPQEEVLGGARVWILPNPSGLNAHWTMPGLVAAFRELREAAAA